MTVFIAQLNRSSRWGTLGLVFLAGDFALLALFLFSFLTLHLLLTINFISLTMISSSDIFANKRHVTSRLSLVNIPALNYLLGSEIFISEVGSCEPLT